MVQKLTDDEVRKLTHGIPPTRYPWALERYYLKQLRGLLKRWDTVTADNLKWLLNPIITGGYSLLKLDDDTDRSNDIQTAVAILLMALTATTSDNTLMVMAQSFVRSVDTFSEKNTNVQLTRVGRAIPRDSATIDGYMQLKIKENVALIKSVRSEYASQIEKAIYRAVNDGGGVTAVANEVKRVSQLTNNHLALIANDQTGKVVGQLNAYRQQQAGAKRYVWIGMGDSRERPAHVDLNNTVQYYDDPNGGDNGMLPGEPIRCRCVADPIFD